MCQVLAWYLLTPLNGSLCHAIVVPAIVATCLKIVASAPTKAWSSHRVTTSSRNPAKLFVNSLPHTIGRREWWATPAIGRLLTSSSKIPSVATTTEARFCPQKEAIPCNLTQSPPRSLWKCYQSSLCVYIDCFEASLLSLGGRLTSSLSTLCSVETFASKSAVLLLHVNQLKGDGLLAVQTSAISAFPLFIIYNGGIAWVAAPCFHMTWVASSGLIAVTTPS